MKRRPYDFVKRAIDILIAGLALILSLPIQLVVALLVRINLGSPVLFTQQRPGRSGRMFTMYKFRTMRDITEDLVSDEDRITPFGSWLRSTSLDELPEFSKKTLEVLREPIEDRTITVARANATLSFPSSIILIVAMNEVTLITIQCSDERATA